MLPIQYNLDFRKRQIDRLADLYSVIEVDENEYCVHFESGGRNFMLTVLLGPNFPNERPKLILSPIVQHGWVDGTSGEVKTAGLINYSQHADLGRVVQAIIREYERFPPALLKPTNTNGPNTVPRSTNATPSPKLQPAKSLDSSDNSPIECGKLITMNKQSDNSLPNLSTLSLEELKQLDSNTEFFDDFIEEMSVVQHLNEELDSMINQVESISRDNESKETNLVELKRKLSDDVTTLKHLGEKCDELNKKYLKKSEEFAPQHIRELLQIAASNADTECDHHVEQFLNGKIDVQTFLNNYAYSKKISSERKAKEERLGIQLNALERAGI